MSLNSPIIVRKLEREIVQTHRSLQTFKVRQGHAILDHTVARYIWGAIATTRLVLTIARDRRFIGAMPLIRQLLETTFTLKHLLNSDNPDQTAVRVLVWDILNAEENSGFKTQVFSAEKAIQEVSADLESLAESSDLIKRIYNDARKNNKRHWHWSGRAPGAMIREILLEGPAAVADQFETNIFRCAWADMSVESHATARWHIPSLTFSSNDRFDFDDPLGQDNQKAAGVAGMASFFLQRSREYVAEYYDIKTS